MADGRKRDEITFGCRVRIVEKENQKNGKLTEGIVSKILTNAAVHPHGIKVELENGAIGRVKEIVSNDQERQTSALFTGIPASKLNSEYILSLLSEGENQTVEFKASFRFDNKRFEATGVKEKNREVEKAISKTVASFMNTKGGFTLIGVNDDGTVVGIESDLELMNKHNADTFRLQLKNSLESYLLNKIIYEHC